MTNLEIELKYNGISINEIVSEPKRQLLKDIALQFTLKFLPYNRSINHHGGIGINVASDDGHQLMVKIDWKKVPEELKQRLEAMMRATPPLGYKPLQ